MADLVDDAVPGKACIGNDNVDLAIPKLSRPLYQIGDVGVVEQVAGDGERAAAGLVDLARDICSLGWASLVGR